MPRLAEYILTQALPYTFRVYGFLVYQEDENTIVLEHEGETVDRFNAMVEYHILINACKDHLVKEHGYDIRAL